MDIMTKYIRSQVLKSDPKMAKEFEKRINEGLSLSNRGDQYKESNSLKESKECYEQALEIFQSVSDKQNEGDCLNKIGNIYLELGDSERAINNIEKSLDIARSLSRQSLSLKELAGVNHDKALNAKIAYDKHKVASRLFDLGDAFYNINQVEKTIEYYEESLSIYNELELSKQQTAHIFKLGCMYSLLGDKEKSIKILQEALSLSIETGDRSLESLINKALMGIKRIHN